MRRREIKSLIESTADPAFSVNAMQNIEAWNQAAEVLFGIRAVDAIGKSCSSVINGYDECGKFCSEECCILDAAVKNKKVRNFDLQIGPENTKTWCNVSILIADVDEAVGPSSVHVLRPIDVSKRLEVLVRDFVVNETGVSAKEAEQLTKITRTPARETSLSPRELEVLKLLANGKTSKTMAEELCISPTTVNNHVQHVLKKLNAHTRLEAVRRAERAGLI